MSNQKIPIKITYDCWTYDEGNYKRVIDGIHDELEHLLGDLTKNDIAFLKEMGLDYINIDLSYINDGRDVKISVSNSHSIDPHAKATFLNVEEDEDFLKKVIKSWTPIKIQEIAQNIFRYMDSDRDYTKNQQDESVSR